MGVQDNDNDPSVNGLEKLGSSVTGLPSVDLNYLPLKKRRNWLRSPSPPPQTPLDGICARDNSVSEPEKLISNNLVGEQINKSIESGLVSKNLTYTEDSYGISPFSADFCKGADVDNAKIDVIKEKLPTPHSIDNAKRDVIKENLPSPHSIHNAKIGVIKENLPSPHSIDNAKICAVKENLPTPHSTDTSMDKQFSEKSTACPEEKNLILEDIICGASNVSLDKIDATTVSPNFLNNTENDAEKCSSLVKDVRLHWDLNTVMDEWDLPADDQNNNSQVNFMENVSGGGLQNEESSNLQSTVGLKESENVLKLLNCNSKIEDHSNNSHFPEQPLEEKKNTSTKLTMLVRENIFTSATQLSHTVPMKNVKLEVHDDVSIKSQEKSSKLFDVPSIGNTVSKFIIPTEAGNSSSKPEKAIMPLALIDKKIISPPVTTLNECQPALNYIKRENDIISPPNVASKVDTMVNSSSEVETKELMPKSDEHFNKVAIEDPLDDGDISDISLGGHAHLVRNGKINNYPRDCNSPVEDGELRETVALSWEVNECEAECLDYDIDEREAYDFGAGNICMSEAGSESIQNDDNLILPEKETCESVNNSLKESSNSASVENVSEKDQIAVTVEASKSKKDEIVASDFVRRLEPKRSFSEEIRPREMREKLSLRIGDSPVSGPFDEKEPLYMQQGRSGSRFQSNQMFRSDKYLGRERHVPHTQDERHKNNWVGAPSSYADSRNNFRNNYRGGGFSRPRNNIPEIEKNDEELNYQNRRQSPNNSSKGVYRTLIRRRPLDNNDNISSTYRRNIESRDDSSHKRNIESRDDDDGMIRGRSGIYHSRSFKGPRNENYGHISDDSAQIRNKNPSFSRPYRRSRSRSRTRSPIRWHQQEERNKGQRMEKTRINYENSNFEDNNERHLSPPRKHFFNDRNGGPSHFRGRNSPGRFVGQRRGFDSRDSSERMKSDDGFGHRTHPQRFSKPSGENWRGQDRNNNDDERNKYRDRNDINRRGRNCDNDGAGRRFRGEGDNSFEICKTRNNNNNDWEGRGSFKYDRERM